MQISYFGLTSFRFSSKDKVAITDPFDKSTGLTPPRGNADIVILSEPDCLLYSYTQSISGQPFMINGPGEYDVKDHTITGIPIKDKDNHIITIYLIEIEGVKILDLAHIKKLELTQDQLEDLGDVDILIVPTGNKSVLDYDTASKTVNLIEPKIVIPSHYKIPGLKLDLESEEKFLKQMGGKFEKTDKISIKKKELPEQGTKVIVLEAMR